MILILVKLFVLPGHDFKATCSRGFEEPEYGLVIPYISIFIHRDQVQYKKESTSTNTINITNTPTKSIPNMKLSSAILFLLSSTDLSIAVEQGVRGSGVRS